jgi:hypothetical protein
MRTTVWSSARHSSKSPIANARPMWWPCTAGRAPGCGCGGAGAAPNGTHHKMQRPAQRAAGCGWPTAPAHATHAGRCGVLARRQGRRAVDAVGAGTASARLVGYAWPTVPANATHTRPRGRGNKTGGKRAGPRMLQGLRRWRRRDVRRRRQPGTNRRSSSVAPHPAASAPAATLGNGLHACRTSESEHVRRLVASRTVGHSSRGAPAAGCGAAQRLLPFVPDCRRQRTLCDRQR